MALAVVLALEACAPNNPKSADLTRLPSQVKQMSVAQLVDAIVQKADLAKSVVAVQEVFARAGVATTDLDRVYVPAIPPTASAVVSPEETLNLALEARQRAKQGTLTVDQLGQQLQELGFPFSLGRTPGEHLLDFLVKWGVKASKTPNDAESFNALFLWEMIKRQEPPLDDALTKPSQVRLSLLELEIFAAAFDRGIPKTAAHLDIPRLTLNADPPQASDWLDVLFPANKVNAAGEGPCSAIKARLGTVGDVYGAALKVGFAPATLEVMKEAGTLSAHDAHKIEGAMHALGIAARLWKLAALYRSIQVEVTVEGDNPAHKPDEGTRLLKAFHARAGISDEDWNAYKDTAKALESKVNVAFHDCMKSVGLPTFETMADVAKEADKWQVEWSIVEGSPEHAFISLDANTFDFTGQLQHKLKRSGDHSASAVLYVDIVPEWDKDHHPPGEERTAEVTVKTETETSQGLSYKTFANAIKGPLRDDAIAMAESLVDVLAGWAQEIWQPKSYATLKVTYHQSAICRGTITNEYTEKYDQSDGSATVKGGATLKSTWEIIEKKGIDPKLTTVDWYEARVKAHYEYKVVNRIVYEDGVYLDSREAKKDIDVSTPVLIEMPQSRTGPYTVKIAVSHMSSPYIMERHEHWHEQCGDCGVFSETGIIPFPSQSISFKNDGTPTFEKADLILEVSQPDVHELNYEIGPKQIEPPRKGHLYGGPGTTAFETWQVNLICN